MIIRTILTMICFCPAFLLALRRNLHMFQLNGYKNDEHFRWITKNLRHQLLLFFALGAGILRILFPVAGFDIALWVLSFLIFLEYRAMMRLYAKKKLVYTARVKRLTVTCFAVLALVIALTWACAGFSVVSGVLGVMLCAAIFLPLLSNLINHPLEWGIRQYYFHDAKRILRNEPDLKIIGITGSFGKTSVKYYLKTLLSGHFRVLATPGNFNTPLGVTITVREHLKPGTEVFLCEMGARRVGEIKELCDLVHPECGIITAVGPQHLETFHSIENIRNTKFELADAVKGKGPVFLNGDNDLIREKAPEYRDRVMYFSGPSKGIGYYAKDVAVSRQGTEFTVVSPDGEAERFRMRLIGSHNVINVVGSIAVANRLGIPLSELVIPVRRLCPVEHRMELKEHGEVTIIDDAYNSNPVGSKAAVETLKEFPGIRILITPGMVELGEKEAEYNRKFGTYAAACCDYIFLVGKKKTEPIRDGILSCGFPEKKCVSCDTLEEAMSLAYAVKEEGHKYILLENDLPDNY